MPLYPADAIVDEGIEPRGVQAMHLVEPECKGDEERKNRVTEVALRRKGADAAQDAERKGHAEPCERDEGSARRRPPH